MHRIAVFFAGALGAAALMAPLFSMASLGPGLTAGGRIVTQPIPCLNGVLFFTYLSNLNTTSLAPIPSIYVPGTPTVYAGPPRNVGQEIGGFQLPTLLPTACVISWVPFVAFPAFPFTYMVGTSLY